MTKKPKIDTGEKKLDVDMQKNEFTSISIILNKN